MNRITLTELHLKFPHLDELDETARRYEDASPEEQNAMDANDDSDYTFERQYWLEVYYCLGNKYESFKPKKDCSHCDLYLSEEEIKNLKEDKEGRVNVEDFYLCLECELEQLDCQDEWEFKYA